MDYQTVLGYNSLVEPRWDNKHDQVQATLKSVALQGQVAQQGAGWITTEVRGKDYQFVTNARPLPGGFMLACNDTAVVSFHINLRDRVHYLAGPRGLQPDFKRS